MASGREPDTVFVMHGTHAGFSPAVAADFPILVSGGKDCQANAEDLKSAIWLILMQRTNDNINTVF